MLLDGCVDLRVVRIRCMVKKQTNKPRCSPKTCSEVSSGCQGIHAPVVSTALQVGDPGEQDSSCTILRSETPHLWACVPEVSRGG